VEIGKKVQARIQAMRRRAAWPFMAEIFPLLAGVVAFIIANGSAPERAPESFYSVAASVIPVLLLTLALELRLLALRSAVRGAGHERSSRRFACCVACTPASSCWRSWVAELRAMFALAEGSFRKTDPDVILAAIALGLVAIGVAALRQTPVPGSDA
jgi:hypothetical protein